MSPGAAAPGSSTVLTRCPKAPAECSSGVVALDSRLWVQRRAHPLSTSAARGEGREEQRRKEGQRKWKEEKNKDQMEQGGKANGMSREK